MKTRICTLSILLLMCHAIPAVAQEGFTVRNDSIRSEVLKQKRKISIFLPDGYDKSSGRFPVIYVLDADGRDQHVVPTARFLFMNNKMPGAIIVGVFNIDRNHDFLPDSSSNAPTGGGADAFARFFRKELIPYMNSNFRTDSFNVLVGHSYGGLFAVNTLLTDPGLFNACIAIDPSIWYKNRMMIARAHSGFTQKADWGRVLFVTGRTGVGMKDMGIDAFDSLLKSSAPPALAWKVVAYDNEDHGSVTFKSAYDGLRYIFDTGGNFDIFPSSGILPEGTSTYAIIENNNPGLHYTLDGSEPGADSPRCADTIRITHPCTLKVKSVSGFYNRRPAVERIFSRGDYLSGLKSVSGLKPGLKYAYYEGVWDSVPDFTRMKPLKTGVNASTGLSFAAKRDSFGVRFEGYVHIEKKGLYLIWETSDDGSKVYFNSSLFLNNDGLHDAGRPVAKMVPLMPGYYPLVIDFFERTGDESVTMGTLDDKFRPVPMTKEMFFHREGKGR